MCLSNRDSHRGALGSQRLWIRWIMAHVVISQPDLPTATREKVPSPNRGETKPSHLNETEAIPVAGSP